jgi:hypothetical protein
MARGKKTGGRNFKKGQGGRKKGAKNKVPGSFKSSVKALYEEIAAKAPELLHNAIVKGLKAAPPKSYQYLQLGAYYIDGKPAETVNIRPDLSGLTDDEIQQLELLRLKIDRKGVPPEGAGTS